MTGMKTTAAALALSAVAAVAATPKKFIFSSWEVNDCSPAEILAHADEFDRTGCDGLAISIDGFLPGAGCNWGQRRHVMEEPRWLDGEIDGLVPTLRAIAAHPSLSHSFLYVNTAPRATRLDWTDDAVWSLCASNMRVVARCARLSGFDGIVTDFEDYWKKKQFSWRKGDPVWEQSKALARSRGAEVFGAVFAEYPDAAILSFQLLTTDAAYRSSIDPAAQMESKRDLWPPFVNGILDAMPPGAKLVDGNESDGYFARAARGHFTRGVRDQLVGSLPLVAPENRAKYRAQVSVSFGLYMDSYAVPTNSPYYFGPVRGKRINHFEDNLRAACSCADEYVWFWGEKGFWIDWPADLKDGTGWIGTNGTTWRSKYYEGVWGRIRPWNETLDGNFDLMARGVKNPFRCVMEESARQKAAGRYVDFLAGHAPGVSANGSASVFIRDRFAVDGWYGLTVQGRGEVVRGNVYFQCKGEWRWNLGGVEFEFSMPDADGWRHGAALVRFPEGATDIYVTLDAGEDPQGRTVEYRNLEVFKITI